MLAPSPELTAMISAARAAGGGLMSHFRGPARAALQVSLKGPADFVSTADFESEATIRSALLGAFPNHGFVAEESAATSGADAAVRFIVDPLDGTTNFLHGVPHFAVSIGLERDGRLVAGVVFDPPKGEMFVAEAGHGAWLVGAERLGVSKETDLGMALIGTGIPHGNRIERHARYLGVLAGAMRDSAGIRRFSAAALDLSYVAAGRLDAFFELGLAPWDIAAGALLVREAGGCVTDPSGSDDVLRSGDVLATNGHLHPRMQQLVLQGAPAPAG